MAVINDDLVLYGSNFMQETDSGTVGGVIATAKGVEFVGDNLNGGVGEHVVGRSVAGTADQSTTIGGYQQSDLALTEDSFDLNDTTPVEGVITYLHLLKSARLFGSSNGDFVVEGKNPVRTGTAQSGSSTGIQFDAGASAVDDFYLNMVVRLDGGTGSGQARRAIGYVGATKTATVDRAWTTALDSSTKFILSQGFYHQFSPIKQSTIRQVFYDATSAGSPTPYYEKVFIRNTNGVDTLTTGVVKLQSDPNGYVTFGLAAALNDSDTTTDRKTAPSGITFDNADKTIPSGGSLAPADRIAVWLKLTLPGGQPSGTYFYRLHITADGGIDKTFIVPIRWVGAPAVSFDLRLPVEVRSDLSPFDRLHFRHLFQRVSEALLHTRRILPVLPYPSVLHTRMILGQSFDLLHTRRVFPRKTITLFDDDIQRPVGRADLQQ